MELAQDSNELRKKGDSMPSSRLKKAENDDDDDESDLSI